MIKATSIGKTIVAFIGGKMFQKEFSSTEERIEVYERLMNVDESNLNELNEVKELFKAPETSVEKQLRLDFEKKKEETKHLEDILDFMKDVKANGHDIFEVIENSIYVKGIRISTPELLIREINTANEAGNTERVKGLLNFWKLCALNPDPRARFDLFKFLKNHNLTITPSGHFVAYRTVNVKKKGDAELEKFITQEYLKVKRWKKAPSNYIVYKVKDGSYFSTMTTNYDNEVVGNLKYLYGNISGLSGNVYTDAHTNKMIIKMGEPVRMDRAKVDPDINNSCSYGLNM